jgi:hypothetical protein
MLTVLKLLRQHVDPRRDFGSQSKLRVFEKFILDICLMILLFCARMPFLSDFEWLRTFFS